MSALAFHHFGLAVKKSSDAVSFLTAMGYRLSEPVFDANQNVNLMMGTHAHQPAVEVIYPAGENGPINEIVRKHTDGIIYHLCYTTENLSATLQRFKTAGLRVLCVSAPKPAPLFQGRNVSFYHVTGMGLIEILE